MFGINKILNTYKKYQKPLKNIFILNYAKSFTTTTQSIDYTDTIYSLSSGFTKAGVSIIRISGLDAWRSLILILNKQYEFQEIDKDFILVQTKTKKRYAHFTKFYSSSMDVIDQGIYIYFQAPNSFTGEDVVEFHVHGSKAVQNKFLTVLSKMQNYRFAQPGEFTKRAFFNGKLDLLEVEGLADLLNAETEEQRKQSINQYTGRSSLILEQWRTELIKCLAHAEAFIDFQEDQDDVKVDVYDKVSYKIAELIQQIKKELNNSNKGEILRDGYKISILGPPNTGKSSLLNTLAQRDIAIVSDIPGTTRDVISVMLNISGYPVILYDTAGIRDTQDYIEKQGILRSRKASEESHCNLILIDSQDVKFSEENKLVLKQPEKYNHIKDLINCKKSLIFLNKTDLFQQNQQNDKEIYLQIEDKIIQLSGMITCCGIQPIIKSVLEAIQQRIEQLFFSEGADIQNSNSNIITNSRHRIELTNCVSHLECFLQFNTSIDISCEELRQAVVCIGRITGRIDVEEVLDVLFKDFCIGK